MPAIWLAAALVLAQEPAPLRAGFAEVDITPPVGVRKCGWNNKLHSTSVRDPLFARVAVLEAGAGRIALVSLDLLFVHREETAAIREGVEKKFGFPGRAILVGATHNHAGPAIEEDLYPKEEEYVKAMVGKTVACFGKALEARADAALGFGRAFEWEVAFNRRVVMRDGTARCHGSLADPNALASEGPVDPEVAVVAARGRDGALLGSIVNFACHPCHHGGDGALSAGYPGALAKHMKERGSPVTLFLQGACGNTHHADPGRARPEKSMDEIGRTLAEDAFKAIGTMKFRERAALGSASRALELPFRKPTEAEMKGTSRGAQRFGEPGFYDKTLPALLDRIRTKGTEPAEVQALFVDRHAIVAIPAEYFVQYGLRIKEEGRPRETLVVGYANGMLGYVPTREAFRRGGYETTFGIRSKLAPEAGDLLAEAALDLLKEGPK